MLKMLFEQLALEYSVFNVFRYLSFRAICAVLTALLFSFLFLSVSAFGGSGTFGASVRSLMALGASRLSTALGKLKVPSNRIVLTAAESSISVFLGRR